MTTRLARGGLLAGLLCLGLGGYWMAGIAGLAAAGVVGAVTVADRPPYDIAAAQVAVAVLSGPPSQGLLVAEAGVLLLFATRLVENAGLRWASVGVGAGVAFAGLGIAVIRVGGTIGAAAAVLVFTAGFIAYAAHRYERVTLGLAEGSS